jgi:hypothetical protein
MSLFSQVLPLLLLLFLISHPALTADHENPLLFRLSDLTAADGTGSIS